jgi:restriction system protein
VKCACQTGTHGHEPGACEREALTEDTVCQSCYDAAGREAVSAMPPGQSSSMPPTRTPRPELFVNQQIFYPQALALKEPLPVLKIEGILIPGEKTPDGILVKSTSLVWNEIVDRLGNDWTEAYRLDPRNLEEIIAGAFEKAGFDEVTLTPPSGDHGRDVIAVKRGFCSFKVLVSAKRYKPGHVVTAEEVYALLGRLTVEGNASKGIVTTTSDFAPRIRDDADLVRAMPTRLELINGPQLQTLLADLRRRGSFKFE